MVALKAGHPVYFVIFFPGPAPGQTLAHVSRDVAEFLRIVGECYPKTRRPVASRAWRPIIQVTAVGTAAGAAISAPLPIVDPRTRQSLGSHTEDLSLTQTGEYPDPNWRKA